MAASRDGAPAPTWVAGIRGLLFDIGDTLISAGRLQRESLHAVAERLEEIGWPAAGHPFVASYLRADADPLFDELDDLNHLYSDRRIVQAAFAALGIHCRESDVQRFLRAYRSALRERIEPDAAWQAALDVLRSRGLRLGIVSNGTTAEQYDQLDRLGLTAYFDPILISQQVGVRKPSPEILWMGARHWGLNPSEIAVVGDRLDWEAAAARRAGRKSILTVQYVDHRHAGSGETPDAIIHGPDDLLTLVESGHASIQAG